MNGQTDPRAGHQDDAVDEAAEQTDDSSEAVADGDAVDTGEPVEAADTDPVAELQARADENWDRYLRAAAELENVRKRAARDVENAHKYALESFSRELLAVKDSLEMGIEAADTANVESLLEGKEATLKLLGSTLERFGVTEVNPEGEPFDPELHEAMTMQPSTDAEPGSVLTVVQKGYTLNGRLLRPARVVVAADAPPDGEN
ncbi:MAG: nucleotide exchange factor GrpE [Woeseiaceae bacterium]|nr:nucleotide exchange factor GrpE [Woeseiaceae bacterium]